MKEKAVKIVIVVLLAATGLVHWFLPAIHKIVPGAFTRGLIPISHDTLHVLFNLNGVGYFILMGIILDWFPVRPKHMHYVYAVIALYAAATIAAWVVFSDPVERTALDYIDKSIEVALTGAAIWMFARLSRVEPQAAGR